MRRFSILGMMGGVGMIAVCLTALRNADEFWQGIAVTLTLGCLGVAILGARQLRGSDSSLVVRFRHVRMGVSDPDTHRLSPRDRLRRDHDNGPTPPIRHRIGRFRILVLLPTTRDREGGPGATQCVARRPFGEDRRRG